MSLLVSGGSWSCRGRRSCLGKARTPQCKLVTHASHDLMQPAAQAKTEAPALFRSSFSPPMSTTSMATKRSRTEEFEMDDSLELSPSSSVAKAQRLSGRAASEGSHHILCTLPPTCHPPHNKPTIVANTQELESHYAKYHAFVCEEEHCGAVFPGPRLLELVGHRASAMNKQR